MRVDKALEGGVTWEGVDKAGEGGGNWGWWPRYLEVLVRRVVGRGFEVLVRGVRRCIGTWLEARPVKGFGVLGVLGRWLGTVSGEVKRKMVATTITIGGLP